MRLSNISESINKELYKLKEELPNENIDKIKYRLNNIEKIWERSYKMMLSFNDHNDVVNVSNSLSSAMIYAERENYDELCKSLSDFDIHFDLLMKSNMVTITNIM